MIKIFANDEQGAVTVDWVALTAGIVLVGIVVVYAVMSDSADGLLDQFDLANDQYTATSAELDDLVSQVSIGQ